MTLYGLKSCDTCRAALKALRGSGKAVDFVDIRAEPPSEEFLSRLLDEHGDQVVNRRSTTWRNLDDATRTKSPISLLFEHPTLMKRPVIERDGALYLGWNEAVRYAVMD